MNLTGGARGELFFIFHQLAKSKYRVSVFLVIDFRFHFDRQYSTKQMAVLLQSNSVERQSGIKS